MKVLLYNDVPMEIVSELLGHSSIKITQEYYGKVVQKKVGLVMANVAKKLNQCKDQEHKDQTKRF